MRPVIRDTKPAASRVDRVKVYVYAHSVCEEETLIPDARACVSPAEMVEKKFYSTVGRGVVPVSQLRATRSSSR